jgi:hypothetical protein
MPIQRRAQVITFQLAHKVRVPASSLTIHIFECASVRADAPDWRMWENSAATFPLFREHRVTAPQASGSAFKLRDWAELRTLQVSVYRPPGLGVKEPPAYTPRLFDMSDVKVSEAIDGGNGLMQTNKLNEKNVIKKKLKIIKRRLREIDALKSRPQDMLNADQMQKIIRVAELEKEERNLKQLLAC